MSKIVQIFCAFMVLSGSVVAQQSFSGPKTDTQLICAVKSGDRKAVKKLLKSGVDVNQFGQDYKTALDAAVEYGYTKIALDLMKYDAKVTCDDNQKYLTELCKEHSKSLWGRFPIMLLACAAVAGIAVPIVLFGILFSPMQMIYYIYPIFFISYCAAGAVLVGYTISLPFQANSWSKRSELNWMLPVSTIN